MKNTRRLFLKLTGILSLGWVNLFQAIGHTRSSNGLEALGAKCAAQATGSEENGKSIIGRYGKWAQGLL